MPPRCCAVPKEAPAAIVERASGVVRGSIARALEAFRDGPSIWLKHKQNVRHDENLIMAGVLFIVKRGRLSYDEPIKQRTEPVRERMLLMYYSSGNYEAFARPRKPEGVDHKSAYLIGTGLAALTAACYLVRDGQMKGERIHIFEKDPTPGGACDGWKFENVGYVMRGGREMDNHFEVMWDLFRSIPSVENEGVSVLDGYRKAAEGIPCDLTAGIRGQRDDAGRQVSLPASCLQAADAFTTADARPEAPGTGWARCRIPA